jgi:hypothetical protein
MMAYTPGTWFAALGEVYEVRDSEGGRICILTHFRGPHGLGGRRADGESADNAKLIAAAPELLDALKLAMGHIRMLEDGIEELRQLGATAQFCGVAFDHERARAAIAKAEGRQKGVE